MMLPKSPLPNTALSTGLADGGQSLLSRDSLDKLGLDQSPSRREIRIIRRQGPYSVHVIRQHNERVDVKRTALQRPFSGGTQQFDLVGQQAAAPVEQIDGEEPAAARNERAAIIRHRRTIEP
jgi:hypothetical protein